MLEIRYHPIAQKLVSVPETVTPARKQPLTRSPIQSLICATEEMTGVSKLVTLQNDTVMHRLNKLSYCLK